jgi:hypothetical protein
MICTAHQYYSDDQIKNEMGGACGTYEGQQRDHFGDPGLFGRIILKRIVREIGCGGMD